MWMNEQRLIDANRFEVIGGTVPDGYDVNSYLAGCSEILEMIYAAPTVDAVSPGVVEQFRWERDTAIAQLQELGIGFGQKKPDMVEVVRCKDCKHHRDSIYGHVICTLLGRSVRADGYCHNGAKMDAEVEG